MTDHQPRPEAPTAYTIGVSVTLWLFVMLMLASAVGSLVARPDTADLSRPCARHGGTAQIVRVQLLTFDHVMVCRDGTVRDKR